MLLVSVMGIKPKQEGASFDIVVVVDPLSKGNNATPFLASQQTSFGVRLSRIHFSPRTGEMNAWQKNPKGRLRGGYTFL